MTIDELIDYVQQDLTISCTLPVLVPNTEIRRLIVDVAQDYFYENYYPAVQKVYYIIPKQNFRKDPMGNYLFTYLPCEIQNLVWLHPVTDNTLYRLGIAAPNLSLSLGVTNQPYLSSFTTDIGELGVYKTIIDHFANVLNMMSKHTVKFDFNMHNKRLNILTSIHGHLMAEAYARIAVEDLYDSQLFRRYVVALAREQMGRLVTRYNFNLPGGIQINGDAMLSEAQAEKTAVMEEFKRVPNNGFFFMVK